MRAPQPIIYPESFENKENDIKLNQQINILKYNKRTGGQTHDATRI